MARRRKKLGEILVGWNVVSADALKEAISYASEHGKRVGEALIELELASEEEVTKALAAQFDLEYVDLDKNVKVPSALNLVPDKVIKEEKVLPMEKVGNRLKVIISDPLDLELHRQAAFPAEHGVRVRARPEEQDPALHRHTSSRLGQPASTRRSGDRPRQGPARPAEGPQEGSTGRTRTPRSSS
jgi:hypothetical protein